MAKTKTTEPAPDAAASTPKPPRDTKLARLITTLREPEGADISAMMAVTGWQAHSVRGAIAGTLKKKLGLTVESEKRDGVRYYRITSGGEG